MFCLLFGFGVGLLRLILFMMLGLMCWLLNVVLIVMIVRCIAVGLA